MKSKWPDCNRINKWEQSCSIMELIREISNDFGIFSFIEVRFDGLMCVWFWTVLKSEVSPLLGIHFESGSMEPSDESGLSEPSFWRIFLLLQLLWNLSLLICWWGYKKPGVNTRRKSFGLFPNVHSWTIAWIHCWHNECCPYYENISSVVGTLEFGHFWDLRPSNFLQMSKVQTFDQK